MEVARVQTLADGGTRWTFDLPEGHALDSAQLIVCKEQGAVIDYVLTVRMPSVDTHDVWEGTAHAD